MPFNTWSGQGPGVPEPVAQVRRWQRQLGVAISVTDLVVIAVSVMAAQALRFGFGTEHTIVFPGGGELDLTITYTVVSIVIVAGWALALRLFGTRDPKIIGTGMLEYRRLTNATLAFFGVLAIVAFALQAQVGRAYLLVALPLGWVLLMLSRWLWRHWLIRRRRHGLLMSHAIVVGDAASASHVAAQIQGDTGCGITIVGAVVGNASPGDTLLDSIPVLGDWSDLLGRIDQAGADTVIVTGNHPLTPRQLRELGWGLEERKASLIVAPALTDIAGPRIHSTPVAGLPLIHVDYPEFTGVKLALKRTSDLVASILGLIILAPVFLVTALTIWLTSPGPAIYRQERVGMHGRPFRMLKFRTMVVDAEQQLSSLLDASEGNGVLFKMRSDPRITRFGRFLRRYSIDELPQLWNVIKGDMSLVGPRPPLANEVRSYERWVHRRLLVKPGITGLWQVSGRSNLSWDDSVRLDLYYVENWSLTADFIIMWRTIRAVMRSDGAY
jgi:exopolysaccharide biosynthesis polyprenyl glycosylphosphotransferase